jgi:hypothetical protein
MTMKLSDTRFTPADFKVGRYAADVPVGTTLEDVLHPEFFGNCLDKLRAGMEVTVLSEDFELDARLRVLTTSKTTAKVRVLDVYAGAGVPKNDTELPKVSIDNIDVNWGGPNHKWRFLHAGSVVEHGFATEGEASEAAMAYIEKANG